MRWLLGMACLVMATVLVADQRRVKLEKGEDGWFDFNMRDLTKPELARSTVWSHDTWIGVTAAVPIVLAVVSAVKR